MDQEYTIAPNIFVKHRNVSKHLNYSPLYTVIQLKLIVIERLVLHDEVNCCTKAMNN